MDDVTPVTSPADFRQAEITASLRRGFADLDAGRVRPAEQAIRDLAVRLGLEWAVVDGRG